MQAQAIALLVQGHGPTDAAKILGISRTILWHWRKEDAAYRKALDDAQLTLAAEIVDEAVAESLARLRALSPKVVEAFERGLDSKDDSLALKAGDIVAKRIAELTPVERHELTIGTLEERIAEAGEAASD